MEKLKQKIEFVLRRFPVTIFFSALMTGIAIVYVNLLDFYDLDPNIFLINLAFASLFGMILSFAVELFAEARDFKARNLLRINVVLFTAIVYAIYFYHIDFYYEETAALRLFVLFAVTGFFAVLLPFYGSKKASAFWDYLVTLVEKTFFTSVYFIAISIGVNLLLIFTGVLFYYSDATLMASLQILIYGFLAPCFFLYLMPKKFEKFKPKEIVESIFTFLVNYLLIPFTLLYLLIVYVYSLKMLLIWEWPVGSVVAPIMALSVLGIVAYVFSKGKNLFRKWFFVALLPVMVVYFFAIGVRVAEYGVTEPRYFVGLYGIWLVFLAGYYILSKRKDLRVLIASLCIVGLISVVGPLSSFSFSEKSQLDRLEGLLEENGYFENGKIEVGSSAFANVDSEEAYEIGSILRYLAYSHGYSGMQDWYDEENWGDLDTQSSNDIMTLLGLN